MMPLMSGAFVGSFLTAAWACGKPDEVGDVQRQVAVRDTRHQPAVDRVLDVLRDDRLAPAGAAARRRAVVDVRLDLERDRLAAVADDRLPRRPAAAAAPRCRWAASPSAASRPPGRPCRSTGSRRRRDRCSRRRRWRATVSVPPFFAFAGAVVSAARYLASCWADGRAAARASYCCPSSQSCSTCCSSRRPRARSMPQPAARGRTPRAIWTWIAYSFLSFDDVPSLHCPCTPPRRSGLPRARVERVRHRVAHEVEGEHGEQQRETREQHVPPLAWRCWARRPRSSGPSSASAAGRPTPRNDSAASNRIAVGRNVVTNTMIGAARFGSSSLTMIRRFDAPSDRAASTNSFSRKRQHLTADDPGRIGPARERDHGDHDRNARLDQTAEAPVPERARRGQPDRQQQVRNRQPGIDRARDERVDPAAVVAGEQPEEDPDHGGDRGRDERHQQRDPGAVDDPAEHVAADLIDPEQVGRARSGRLAEDVERVRDPPRTARAPRTA